MASVPARPHGLRGLELWPCLLLLRRVAHTSGNTEAADRLYQEAHRLHRELGARPLLARGLLDHAESRIEVGDTNNAKRFAAEAEAITSGTQMTELHNWAQRLLTRSKV